ncbi:lymphotoxin-alpha [Sorex araneus]|uniref:lymphotoxin-alpha n=1 Tax=Sorex araneus TaxID=42254 RepID=UPI0024334398|nr:lymphotoxin-alpha [Sorex araneus]
MESVNIFTGGLDSPRPRTRPPPATLHRGFLYKGTQAPEPGGPAQQVLPMTASGHLCFLRARGGAPLLLLLGLLLALPPEMQGLPGIGLSPSGARKAHQHLQNHLAQHTLKAAAHLVGDPSTQESLRWRANTDHAFLRHGFSLSNNSLLVPASGLYFVYSQVVFSGDGCPAEASPRYLAHEVRLLSSQYPSHVPLLSTQKSVCPGPEGPWMRSMYQGAVFLLSRGDQLSTHTDGVAHLFLSPSSVFFGAFAL